MEKVFLFIYWPSFVAGAAQADSQQQQRAIVNTILSLAAGTVCAFWCSSIFSNGGKFRPVDIQNATLAGGVAIGCVGNLSLSPFGAIMIGSTAGLVSCVGYNKLQPYLERQFGLHDTCGIHNLHAMPSVVGALSSVILGKTHILTHTYTQDHTHIHTYLLTHYIYDILNTHAHLTHTHHQAGYKGSMDMAHDANIYGNTAYDQWWRQLVGICVCITFAISTGMLVGMLLKLATPGSDVREFHDDQWWVVAEDYGRSLYTELGLVVQGASKNNAGKGFSDWSSHNGKTVPNTKLAALDSSTHAGRRGAQNAPEIAASSTDSKTSIAFAPLTSVNEGVELASGENKA